MDNGPDAELERLLAEVSTGHLSERLAPLLAALLETLEGSTKKRIFRILAKGEGLEGTIAIQAWSEMLVYEKLFRAVAKTTKRGHTAARRVARYMPPIPAEETTYE